MVSFWYDVGMKKQISDLLDSQRINYRWLDHPAVFTVAESMKIIEGKKPIKNLLLQEKGNGRKVLVIMAGEDRLDAKVVASKLAMKKLQFANPEVLLATLGVKPGAVSVFGLLSPGSQGIEVVVDEKLLKEPELGFHPNDNTATIFIPGQNLAAIIEATGHKFVRLRF